MFIFQSDLGIFKRTYNSGVIVVVKVLSHSSSTSDDSNDGNTYKTYCKYDPKQVASTVVVDGWFA